MNRKISHYFIPVFVSFHLWFNLLYPSGEKNVGLKSLKIGVGAREIGMGLVGTSQAEGCFALYFNPALSALTQKLSIAFSYADWFLDADQSSLFFLRPTRFINFGFGLILFDYGEVELRHNKPEEKLGDYSPKDISFYFNCARTVSKKFSLGASLRYFYEKIYTNETNQWGIDFGLLYDWHGLRIGFAYLNWGDVLSLKREKFYLPTQAKLGFSYLLPVKGLSFLPAFDLAYSPYEKRCWLAVGGELNFKENIFLRAGANQSNPTFGLGVKKGQLHIDYSLQMKDEFPTPCHHLAFGLR